MTRKHFEAIAAEIAPLKCKDNVEAENMRVCIADRLASLFARENSLFDTEKFMQACDVQ